VWGWGGRDGGGKRRSKQGIKGKARGGWKAKIERKEVVERTEEGVGGVKTGKRKRQKREEEGVEGERK